MRRLVFLVLVVFLSLALFACPPPKPTQTPTPTPGVVPPKPVVTYLKWGSTSVRSGLYANTVAMAKIVNETYPGEIVITVVETGGYLENLVRLQKDLIHLGPACNAAGYASYLGAMDFAGKPDPKLRSLWGGYITPIHLVARADSGITTVEGFHGKPFADNPGTTSGRLIRFFFDANDIKPAYKEMGLGASPDAMKAGVVVGWYKAGWKDAAILDIEAAIPINIVPIRPEHMEKHLKKYPGQGFARMIPAGLYKGQPKEQLSFFYAVGDFVDKDVPADVVYKIVKAIYENRMKLVEPLATLKEGMFHLFEEMLVYQDVPLHPGAVKFYQEIGIKIPDKLIPPEIK